MKDWDVDVQAMRDDIHKSAPVNSKWRRFLKHCVVEADREDRARESVEKALAADCHREIDPQLLQKLVERCSSPDRDLFGSKLDGLDASTGHVLQQQFIDRLRSAERAGVLDGAAMEQALTGVIAERIESQGRAMRGHILREGGRGSAECVKAINANLSALSAAGYARELLSNAGRITTNNRPAGVALDENLL